MKGIFQAALAATLSTIVAGHAIWVEFDVNGVSQGKFNGLRLPTYDGPIENVNSAYMACNGEGQNVLTKISPNVIPVTAGSQITIHYAHTLDTDWKTGMIIDASHKGPLMAYMAKVGDALGPAPTSGWFKIAEAGLSGGKWAVENLISTKGWTFTIPTCVANGDYLLRVELIALHAAGNYPGAQLYMECAQIRVSGGSGTLSPATVSFPGAYSGTDPGIKFNLYGGSTSYVIPGPRPATCAGGSSNPQPTTTAAAVTTVRTTTRSTTTASATRTTAAAPVTTTAASNGGCSVSRYGQCGGNGFSGCTSCSGSTCVKLNDYYSQCQ